MATRRNCRNCSNQALPEYSYCVEHLCGNNGCQRPKFNQSEYCDQHTCTVNGCHAFIKCDQHSCCEVGCTNQFKHVLENGTREPSKYCAEHVIKYVPHCQAVTGFIYKRQIVGPYRYHNPHGGFHVESSVTYTREPVFCNKLLESGSTCQKHKCRACGDCVSIKEQGFCPEKKFYWRLDDVPYTGGPFHTKPDIATLYEPKVLIPIKSYYKHCSQHQCTEPAVKWGFFITTCSNPAAHTYGTRRMCAGHFNKMTPMCIREGCNLLVEGGGHLGEQKCSIHSVTLLV